MFFKKISTRLTVGSLLYALVLQLIRWVAFFKEVKFSGLLCFNLLNKRLAQDVTFIVPFHEIYKNIEGDILGV